MWIFLLIFFQFELSEVLEHPIIFQSSKNNIQEFASQGDIGFCSSPPTFYLFMKRIEIWAVPLCDQRTLNKSCPGNLTALFGNSAKKLFSFLVQNEDLSEDEIVELLEMIKGNTPQ